MTIARNRYKLKLTDCSRWCRWWMGTAIALALLTSTAHAQSKPVAGLNPRLLRLTTDSLEIYIVREGERHHTGTIVDALDTVRVNGELRLQRIYTRTDRVLGNGVDTLVDAFVDLRLRLVDSRSDEGGVEHIEWRDGRVAGTVEQSGKPTRQVDTAAASGVSSSSSFDLILRAAPLAKGYELRIPAFSGRQGAKTLSAKVAASETVPGLGATWRVEADLGGRAVTYWISKDSRRVMRELVRVSPRIEILFLAHP
jgi:hypothetical protein